MNPRNEVSIKQLREHFVLDPKSNKIFWKTSRQGRILSDQVGTLHPKGYRQISLRIDGVSYRLYGHRIAYAMRHGKWPPADVDHKCGAGSRDNNSPDNLRAATSSENKYNIGARSNNVCGLKWVKQDNRPRKNPWRACVRKDKKEYAKGGFSSKEQAYAWASFVAKKLHGEFYNSGQE